MVIINCHTSSGRWSSVLFSHSYHWQIHKYDSQKLLWGVLVLLLQVGAGGGGLCACVFLVGGLFSSFFKHLKIKLCDICRCTHWCVHTHKRMLACTHNHTRMPVCLCRLCSHQQDQRSSLIMGVCGLDDNAEACLSHRSLLSQRWSLRAAQKMREEGRGRGPRMMTIRPMLESRTWKLRGSNTWGNDSEQFLLLLLQFGFS